MRIRRSWTEVYAGERAEVDGKHAMIFDSAEALVITGSATVFEGGRAIVLSKGQVYVREGGRAWIYKKGRATVYKGGEAFAVVGSFVTVKPGGVLHMYSEEEWQKVAQLTWKNAHNCTLFSFKEDEE
jgi:quercetin dioxygenase-like cupin family protein